MKKKLIGVYNPSIILTYIGVACSLFGIMMLMGVGLDNSVDTIRIAMVMLVIAGVCDMFDGTVARMCKRTEQEKEFGVQLDSLADTVCFGVFPACILIKMAHTTNVYTYVIAFFYLFAGIMRLGWFNVTTEDNKGYYQGLPITFSAIIFPVLYIILRLLDVNFGMSFCFELTALIVAFLFIKNFKIKKMGLKACVALTLVSVGAIIALCLI